MSKKPHPRSPRAQALRYLLEIERKPTKHQCQRPRHGDYPFTWTCKRCGKMWRHTQTDVARSEPGFARGFEWYGCRNFLKPIDDADRIALQW